MAWSSIVRGVREGLSAREIGRQIRAGGGQISNAALFEVARRERNIWTHGLNLRYLNRNVLPNPHTLPEALSRLTRAFAFTLEVRGKMLDTNAPIKQYITISTDRVLSPAELSEMAEAIASERIGRYGMAVEDSVLVSGLRAGTLGTL
jgi:hypothetical protein